MEIKKNKSFIAEKAKIYNEEKDFIQGSSCICKNF